MDERNFWKDKEWKRGIKFSIYKEYLKYKYLELLNKVFFYKFWIWKYWKKSFSSKFKEFLKVKNELNYILSVTKVKIREKFDFWFDFNSNGFDKNDLFWYKNRKKVEDISWSDIYEFWDNIGDDSFKSLLSNYIDIYFINKNYDIDNKDLPNDPFIVQILMLNNLKKR